MQIDLYQVDAFTDRLFGGNPAAVCPLDDWLDDAVMQAIAAENNLSETAFFVPSGGGFDLRWFTPAVEVELCGHATLASAHVIFRHLEPGRTEVSFQSRSGPLRVTGEGEMLWLDFPAQPAAPCATPDGLRDGLGAAPVELRSSGHNYLAVFAREAEVRDLEPDFARLGRLDHCVIATALGDQGDFVSRYFAPTAGIDEDPVTGSAHCTLTPYWANRLGRTSLSARQISARGGALECELAGDRVRIGGRCAPYMIGRISL